MNESRNYMCCAPRGLTVVNAALLVKMVCHYDCDVSMGVDGKLRPARNILSVLSLRIACGDFVSIVADGPDANEVIERIGGVLCEGGETEMCLPAYG